MLQTRCGRRGTIIQSLLVRRYITRTLQQNKLQTKPRGAARNLPAQRCSPSRTAKSGGCTTGFTLISSKAINRSSPTSYNRRYTLRAKALGVQTHKSTKTIIQFKANQTYFDKKNCSIAFTHI
jgi:hypothetical protein